MTATPLLEKMPPGLREFCVQWKRELAVALAILAVLAAPFLLRPSDSTAPSRYDRRLVIITPHNQKIRQEFGSAFAHHWRKTTGETLYVDWRVQGTAEISTYLRSEYGAAFEHYWRRALGMPWNAGIGRTVAMSFFNSRLNPGTGSLDSLPLEDQARRAFLESDVGIGIDLFFGGGTPDFQLQSSNGALVPTASDGKYGIPEIFKKHPDWFTDAVIPPAVSGETFYDPNKCWVGSCLSSLGIVYNRDVLRRLGVAKDPEQWTDLADPKLLGEIALSDPNKSGTVTKALEQLIQQQMHLEVAKHRKHPEPFKTDKQLVEAGIEAGWEKGLQLILRISANARYYTDAATKIPLEVSQGDAAAGMCIDFYGHSFEEQVRQPDGSTRVGFVAPVGGTAVSVDPMGMLRGAPEPKVATAFMEFVLSEEGQKIWNYMPGLPGGPEKSALRRMPLRRDFYTPANRAKMTDPKADPYEDAKSFSYEREWTGPLFNVIRFLVKVTCVDIHREQREAWQVLAKYDFPQRALAVFEDVRLINYATAKSISADLKKGDKELENKLARDRSSQFRDQYRRAMRMAKSGM
jgi:ABC-type Fe3+ transport system substrate-binding protein